MIVTHTLTMVKNVISTKACFFASKSVEFLNEAISPIESSNLTGLKSLFRSTSVTLFTFETINYSIITSCLFSNILELCQSVVPIASRYILCTSLDLYIFFGFGKSHIFGLTSFDVLICSGRPASPLQLQYWQ